MPIIQWLIKRATPESPSSNSTSISPKPNHNEDGKTKQKNKVAVVAGDSGRRRRLKGVENSTKLSCEDLILLRFLQRKDVSKPFFYQTLNLKKLRNFSGRRSSELTRRGEKIEESVVSAGALGGNKVLRIADSAHSSVSRNKKLFLDSDERGERKKKKSGKRSVSSRMKELVKWSATAKVTNFKNGSSSDATTDYDPVNESPKISIQWEANDFSTTIIDLQVVGNWITTDSEFVVLEL